MEGAGPRCCCRTIWLLRLHNLSLLGLLLRCLLTEGDHVASVLRDINKRLLLLGYHLSVHLVMGVRMRMVDGNGLGREVLRRERCLTGLRLNTEGLRKGRLLHLLQVRWRVWRCSRIVLLLLELLLSERQSALKLLHHVVALLLLIDELLVKDLVDARYRLFYLREHYLQLPLQLRHYLIRHCLLELVVNNFAHLGVCKLRSSGDSCHRRRECCGLLRAAYRGLYRGGCPSQSLELRLNARDQGRSDLLVKQLGLLLHQRCYGILNLLLDDFGKSCLDSL